MQVVDEHNTVVAPDCSTRVHVVKAEWFWASVQNEEAQDERDYLFKDVSVEFLCFHGDFTRLMIRQRFL